MLRGLILYFIAGGIGSIIGFFGFIAGLIHKDREKYLVDAALAEDQNLNVKLRVLLNLTMLKKKGADADVKFGDNPDHTMSYVIGRNYLDGQLNLHGKFWYWFLYVVDKPARKYGGHCIVAVNHEERKILNINNN